MPISLQDLTRKVVEGDEISDFLLTNKKILPISASEITIGVDEIIVPADYENKLKGKEEFDGLKMDTGRRKSLMKNISDKINL